MNRNKRWHVNATIGQDNTVHVWPENDTIDHLTTQPCICGPRLEEQANGNILVIHHSLDGRELTEP